MTNTVTLLGVGKMGAAFVERWRSAGREVILWNRTASAAQALAGDGVSVASSAAAAGFWATANGACATAGCTGAAPST